MSERKRALVYARRDIREHFWRGKNQQEIDLVEEQAGNLSATEIKWRPQKSRLPSEFRSLYGDIPFSEITREGYIPFLTE